MNGSGSEGAPLRLVIVGGGFTGAVLALHAIRASRRPLDIAVVEPSAVLGRGTAYGTADPSHRINVPSDRMGLLAEDPQQATRWLFARHHLPEPGSDDGQGRFYVPGALMGRSWPTSWRPPSRMPPNVSDSGTAAPAPPP